MTAEQADAFAQLRTLDLREATRQLAGMVPGIVGPAEVDSRRGSP
jgi:hypothetical protein